MIFTILATMGRGEYVRLLLEDAGVDFKYVRHNAAGWQEKKKEMLEQKIRAPTMPFITIDGKYYGKTVPIMRFLSKKLGKYEGANDDEAQLLDSYTDVVMDWVGKWAGALFSNSEETLKSYKEEYAPQAYKTWNDILSDVTSGPYLLGDKITYADFALYHALEDDSDAKVNAESYPHLAAFTQAIQARPNLNKYFATGRK